MLKLLIAVSTFVMAAALIVVAISLVLRALQALPQALIGGALGLGAAVLFGTEPTGTGAIGAALGLAYGLRKGKRERRYAQTRPAVVTVTPKVRTALPPPAPPPPAPLPAQPPRDPDLAAAWDRASAVAPTSTMKGRLRAARARCELLLDDVDAGRGDAAAEEWAAIIRARVPELVNRGATAAELLGERSRDAASEGLVSTLEQVAHEADERRAGAGKAAQDAFDTMRRYFEERTRRDPLDPGTG